VLWYIYCYKIVRYQICKSVRYKEINPFHNLEIYIYIYIHKADAPRMKTHDLLLVDISLVGVMCG
jgi:hypothetical protein